MRATPSGYTIEGARRDREGIARGEAEMNEELLARVEDEVLGWPGVSKERHGGGSRVPPATIYRLGRRALGHIHDTGVADLAFPRRVHDELISDGRARPHGAGFPGVVSYHIREPVDVPRVVELFRMSYDRARAAAERRNERTEREYSSDEHAMKAPDR
jgi:Luciferase